jgi:hypothetical protein
MAAVLAFRWRTSALAPQPQWKRDTAQFAGKETVGDVRARLAVTRGSSADLAADIDPELWLCDDNETPTQRQDAPDLLEWTPATCPRALFERHASGRRKAVLVFTFPPLIAAAVPAPDAQSHRLLRFVAKRILERDVNELDIWTEGKRTRTEQGAFKDALAAYYECAHADRPGELNCMVLGRFLRRDTVRAAHIWKFCTQGRGLEAFGLEESDLGSPRNGLLVAEAIEQAFDIKRLCLLWDPLGRRIVLHVLDPALKPEFVLPSELRSSETQSKPPVTSLAGRHLAGKARDVRPNEERFADIHGRPLLAPAGKYPFRRLLAFHARASFNRALRAKWISDDEFKQFHDFLRLSEGAVDPARELEDILGE